MKSARIITKYPNRRLYDTKESRYVTLADIKKLIQSTRAPSRPAAPQQATLDLTGKHPKRDDADGRPIERAQLACPPT